jgi:hypothetical protein
MILSQFSLHYEQIQGLDNIMETLQIHFFINMVLGHIWPSIQLQSSLEWTRTSFELFLPKFFTILREEHLQIPLEVLEVGNYSSV